VVLMTHRQSVLGACDRILLLVEGQQQAFGPRDEVLAAMQKAQAEAQARAQAAAQAAAQAGAAAARGAAGAPVLLAASGTGGAA
jgi:ATP-binding cassette, subfamily C, bacterial exporter for protease/lipase